MRYPTNPDRRADAEANIYGFGGSSDSLGELNRLDSECGDIHRRRHSEYGEKLLADQGDRMPRLRPLVRTGPCQGLRSLPVLVPSLFLICA